LPHLLFFWGKSPLGVLKLSQKICLFEEIVGLKILLKTNEPYFAKTGNKQLVKNNNLIHSSRVSLDYLLKDGRNVMHLRNICILKKMYTLGSNTLSER